MVLSGLNVVGKSILAAAGVAYGFHRGFSGPPLALPLPGTLVPPSGSSTSAGAGDLAQRVARLEKLVKAGGNADWAIDRTGGVTHQELAEAIDRATARIHSQVDRKFEVQSLSIESLRAMMRQTDQLLEKVLAGLDAAAEREAEAE